MNKIGAVKASQMVREATPDTERLRILLSGDATSGKTFSLQTLPEALKAVGVKTPKIVILDLDYGADWAVGDPHFMVMRFGEIGKNADGTIKAQTRVPGSEPYVDEAAGHWIRTELSKMTDVNVVVIDSLSALSLMSLATIATRNGRFGEPPHLQDWNHEMNTTQQTCLSLQNAPVSHAVITICHTAYEKDDLSGRAYNHLVLTGKLSKKLIRFFPEIYFAHVSGVGGKVQFQWLVSPEQGTTARTQMPQVQSKGPRVPQDFIPVFTARFNTKHGDIANEI